MIVSKVPPPRPRLLEQVRATIRGRHYTRCTEKTYIQWITRFIYFTGKRHPAEMGAPEVTAFLNDLATERNVAAATQNQALSALPLDRTEQARAKYRAGEIKNSF